MRIVDFLTIFLAISLTSVYVHSKPVYGYSTHLLPDDVIRVKKRNEDSTTGYLEQCGPVTFPKAQRGVVNVLAFLDSSWPYSHRQAAMLKMLNDRLRKSGLPDALFFVVNVDPSFLSASDDAEDDIEKEAWLGVSPDEIERFSDIEKTADSLELSMTPDIKLIQDNEDLGIWKKLRGSRDQVLVIDRCGKLTYQVIVPWSILHFPYVKAAILSTYKDEPCGPCDIINNATEALYQNQTETTILASVTESSPTEDCLQNDRESIIVGDVPITTESNLRLEEENITTVNNNSESVVSSTSKYGDESIHDINEETSIARFLKFDITTESTTTPNLISNKDNYTTELELEKPDEFTTLAVSTDITTEKIYLHEAEDGISTNFITSDATHSTITVTSGLTEDILNSEVVTFASFDTIDSNVETTTETLSSDINQILSSEDQLMNLRNETEEDDSTISSFITSGTKIEYSSTSFDTMESMIDTTTTKESLDSTKNEDSHVLQDSLKGDEEIKDIKEWFEMPIRIIMHAPHFHADGDSTRMHEYLVLKTGNSEHHSHLASRDATRLYSGPQDFQEKSDNLPNEDIETKLWSMTNVIYNKDESPGLYGEVADFWRGMGSQEIYDDAEDTERPEEEQIAEETRAGLWKKPSKTNNKNPPEADSILTEKSTLSADDLIAALEAPEMLQADVAHEIATEKNRMNIEEFNVEEEETRNKLIAHYSKLLPWIYYVLDK